MSIINDLQNAICKTIAKYDKSINFTMDVTPKVVYPYVFFYIADFKMQAGKTTEWNRLNLTCVIEYLKEEGNSQSELWKFQPILQKALCPCFRYNSIFITPYNVDYKLVQDVLQSTFELEFYVKEDEVAELMEELEFTINQNRRTGGLNG